MVFVAGNLAGPFQLCARKLMDLCCGSTMITLWFTKLEDPWQIEKGTTVKEKVKLSETWDWKKFPESSVL
jgi:hypothetical protein